MFLANQIMVIFKFTRVYDFHFDLWSIGNRSDAVGITQKLHTIIALDHFFTEFFFCV